MANQVPTEIQLDLLEASALRPTARTQRQLARFEASRRQGDPLARRREALAGGDAQASRKIFLHKAEVS